MLENVENHSTPQTRKFLLRDYFILLRVHLYKILSITLFCLLISIYTTYSKEPKYTAYATIMINNSDASLDLVNPYGFNKKENLSNHRQLIKSRLVSEIVVQELWKEGFINKSGTFESRKFLPRGQSVRNLLKEIFSLGFYDKSENLPKVYPADYDKAIATNLALKIRRNLSLRKISDSDLLLLSFTSPFPKESRLIINKICKVYDELDKKWSSDRSGNLVTFLEKQLNVQKSKLIESEEILKTYKENNKIFSVDGNAEFILQKLIETESNFLNSMAEINIKKEEINALEASLSSDEKSLADALLNDMNIQVANLRMNIGELESQLIKNKTQHGDDHIAVKNTEQRIKNLKKQLLAKTNILIKQGLSVSDPLQHRQEIITNLLTVKAMLPVLISKSNEYKTLVDKYNFDLGQLPEKQINFVRLERDYAVLSQSYTFLLQKLEESKISVASESGKVTIVDKAITPKKVSSPIHSKDILSGFFIGVFLSIGLSLLIEYNNNTIRTVDDITNNDLTLLGIIPSIGDDKNKPFFSSISYATSAKVSRKLQRKLITREDPKSPVSEAYRALRTTIMYSSVIEEGGIKSILVSSSGPGEGKTTTVANLAITFANLGKKTILIDTDLRRPVIHKVFNCDRDIGITTYLTGHEKDFSKLVQKTSIDNLYVCPSGIIPPNPSELLGSKKMSDLVKNLENEWDMVLFDSPPLVAVTDATMVSKEIDSIIIVTKSGHTDKSAFFHTISSLKNVEAPIGGVILNAVTDKNSYGSYYYYYQYYHYYGSES